MTGNKVLVTGASSGFGLASARRFAVAGNHLILLARRTERLNSLREELSQQCPVDVIGLDLSDMQQLNDYFKVIPPSLKDVDILINNAGLALGTEPADKTSLDDWHTMIDTNIKGLVTMTRHILPFMVARDRGHIINIGSMAGNWAYPGSNVYGGTKAFVQQFSRGLRADLVGTKIRVSNIEPGMAETNFSVVRMKGDKSAAAAVYDSVKPLSADDVADAIYWLTALPAHVNVNSMEIMPTCQAWGHLAVDRDMIYD